MYKLTIPLPKYFTCKNVNVYLIKEDPVTLIDTGPFDKQAIEFLKFFLKNLGIDFIDIKRILLTHAHVDHCGLAGYLQDKFNSEVFIHRNDSLKITLSNEDKIKFKKSTFFTLLKSLNISKKLYENLDVFFKEFYQFAYKVEKVKLFNDKDSFDFEQTTLKAFHLPGHTAGSSAFLYNDKLISGDVILDDVFVTPVLEFNENGKSFKNLKNYFYTLKNLSKFKNKKLMPGHGNGNFNFIDKSKEYQNYILKKSDELSNQLNFNLSIEDNYIKIYGDNIDKFFFYFSFFYGLIEFMGLENKFLRKG